MPEETLKKFEYLFIQKRYKEYKWSGTYRIVLPIY